ncbi:Ig-like domain-containing protein [Tenacibaculum sp. UWU-22]|uniref:Ig-like domain-containing protein n=1 Tax=Tenacibaculum sp. UWU-22 TaxID=3234187 RepID=UPI0034DB0D8C
MKLFFRLFFIAISTYLLTSCARRGNPEGGPKDKDAPIMVTATPPYKTIHFNKKEIKIYFDEYIVFKDLYKQLVVSPPLKTPLLITPQGTPTKRFSIKILDTLKPNTTYTLNFGSAIQDNNENNKLESFKYVFSTGSYIDSLTLKGTTKNALKKEIEKNVNVLLYKIDSTYNDSIVYKQKPKYVTSTLDSSNFVFSNLEKGKYLLVALKEENSDYIFRPNTDKIGFYSDTIALPADSVLTKPITIFKEILPYKFRSGKEIAKGKILFGFEGEKNPMKVSVLSKTPANFKSFFQLQKDRDTLVYWFTPFETDSLNFKITTQNFTDTTTVFLRKKKIDSLMISSVGNSTLLLNDTLFLTTNNPIVKIDSSKFLLINKKDTLPVLHQLQKKSFNKLAVLFDKNPNEKYELKILPKAITDLYNTSNDTLTYRLNTKNIDDYGSVILNVQNQKNYPLIIELITTGNEVLRKQFINTSKKVTFSLLEPNKYTVRAIIDSNKNNKWDTGNFLTKTQPEEIIYLEKELNVRANWFVTENFLIN